MDSDCGDFGWIPSVKYLHCAFEFGQGLTLSVGARKLPFLGQVAPLFYRTPGNCWIFGFLQLISPGRVKTEKKQLFDERKSVVRKS
jgi:hypothetical protein